MPPVSTSDESSHLSTDVKTGVRYWGPAIAVSLTTFMVVINASLMNVAIPTMVDEFDTTVTAIQGGGCTLLAGDRCANSPVPSRHSSRRVMAVALIVSTPVGRSWRRLVGILPFSISAGHSSRVPRPPCYFP